MSMFCKFRHRGKSNVFIVISVGIWLDGRARMFLSWDSIGVVILVSLRAGFEIIGIVFFLFDRILILVESMECWRGFMVGNVQDCVVCSVESGLFDFYIQFMG